MDVSAFNLVNRAQIIPQYDLSRREPSIRLFFSRNRKLLIIGQVDNNYIYWASFTNTDDREKNEAIFNYIADKPLKFESVSSMYTLFKTIDINYDKLKNTWYHTDLVRASAEDKAWQTPFGYYYGRDSAELHGRSFAGDVAKHMDVLLERCRFREANGAYEAVLDYCLSKLSSDGGNPFYYVRVEDLINMLRREQYLVLSDHEETRKKYILICEKASDLYNRYQSAER